LEPKDAIKKGRCNIVEKDHLLILGWTDACYLLLREVALALEDSVGRTVVVILCPHQSDERKEMLKRIHDVLPLQNLEVIVRNGFPGNITDLMTVAVGHARTLIVPAPQGDATESDNTVLNITMALKATQLAPGAHIVAELRDVDDEDMVCMLGGGDVVTVVSHDMVGRLMTMAARQPGLADVFSMLLGFDGDEFYLKAWDEIVGLAFGELPELFPDAIVCGYLDQQKKVHLNPPLDYVVKEGDELLVIAESFDSYCPRQPALKKSRADRTSVGGPRVSMQGLVGSSFKLPSSQKPRTAKRSNCQRMGVGCEGSHSRPMRIEPLISSEEQREHDKLAIEKHIVSDLPAQVPSQQARRKSFQCAKSRGSTGNSRGSTGNFFVLASKTDNNIAPRAIDVETYKAFITKKVPHKSNIQRNTKEKFLIIGMRRDLRDILRSMNEISYLSTEVHLFNELTKEEQIDSLEDAGDFKLSSLRNLEIVHHVGNPVSRYE
jgi:hypothetical protein